MQITNTKLDNPILKIVGEEADRLNLDCYVVGGWVRDLFLQRESKDIDILVVNPFGQKNLQQQVDCGIVLAEAVTKKLGKGKTVVTILPDTAERYFSTALFE